MTLCEHCGRKIEPRLKYSTVALQWAHRLASNPSLFASVHLIATYSTLSPTANFQHCSPMSLQALDSSSVSNNLFSMSQSDRRDPERGNDISMFSTGRSAVTSLSSQICVVGGHPNQSQPIQISPLESYQREINYGDRSWPLYAMYSRVTQEDDNKMAERYQKAADGVLVFVSPHFNTGFLHTSIGNHRAVYFLPLSPHCLQSQSQTSSPAPRIPRPSTLRRFTSSLLTRMHPID